MAGYKDQVRGSLDTSPGFMIRSDGMPHRTTTPAWEEETRIRAFPSPITGGYAPIRCSADEFDYGPAVWSEPVARCLGVNESYTYITRIPEKTGDPTKSFVKSVLALIDEKPRDVPESWLMWVKRGRNKAPKIDKVKSCIFFQGMLIMSQGNMLLNHMKQPQPQYPILLLGSVSLQMSFEGLANARVEGYNGPMPGAVQGDDNQAGKQLDAIYAAMFQLGDWCSLDGGRIMSIFQAPPSGTFERPHYAIKMLEPLPLVQIEPQVRSCWRPWNKLLRYHTAEEQIQYLCRAFPAEAVDYAFGTTEYRDLMPKHVQGAWQRYRATQQVWTPGMPGVGTPAPQQQPQQPQQPQPQPQPQQPQQLQQPTGAPMPGQYTAPPQQPPQQPPTNSSVPASQPQQDSTAAPATVGGYNLSGGPVDVPGDEQPIMASGAFGQTPQEFANPQAPAGAAPQQSGRVQTAQPNQTSQGTPPEAAAGGAVDSTALNSALDDLKDSRDQAAGGNLGQ